MADNIHHAPPVERVSVRRGAWKLSTRVLCVALLAWAGTVSAAGSEPKFRHVSIEAWKTLDGASGIVTGGPSGARPSIQIIFDANCPWCARLYMKLKQKYPGTPVRWVPIAYFRGDSGAMAAAILASDDPQTALDTNFRNYDFKHNHGGFRLDRQHRDGKLAPGHRILKRLWRTWGGYTPMLLFRDRKGNILLTGGAADWVVGSVIRQAVPALGSYEERRETGEGNR